MIDNIQTITCTLTRYQNWWRVPEITKIDKKTKMEKIIIIIIKQNELIKQ